MCVCVCVCVCVCAEHKLPPDTKLFDVELHICVYNLIDAALLCTVKPVLSKHLWKIQKVVSYDRCLLNTGNFD